MKRKLWKRKIEQNFIEGDPINDQTFRDELNNAARERNLNLPFTQKRDKHN